MKPFLLLSIVIAVSDQFTKQMIVRALDQCGFGFCDSIDLLPFLKLVLLYNEGAAFSILSDAGGWQRWFLSILAILVCLYIIFWLKQLEAEKKICLPYGLALVLGGALGNVFDRLMLGYVTDYFQVLIYGWAFPSFNIADAAISIGAILIIIDAIKNGSD